MRHIIRWTHRIALNNFGNLKTSRLFDRKPTISYMRGSHRFILWFYEVAKIASRSCNFISKIWGIEETIAVSRFTFKPRLEMAGFSLHCDSPPQLSVGRSSLSIVDVSYAKKENGASR